VTGRADRPGELGGIGPVDPNPEANTSDRYQGGASADPGTPVPSTSTYRTGRYGREMSMWRLTAAAMAARSPSLELTMRSPRRRASSATLA